MNPNNDRSVARLAELEGTNLKNSLELLGDTYDLTTDLELLFDTLPYLCRFPNDVDTNDATFAAGLSAQLVLMCRRQLTLGTLTLLRGYRGDHQYHLRKAIETCAFAAKMGRHPHFARIWLQAGEDDKAFERFRNKFTKLFPDDDPSLDALGKEYDVCAKATHPGIFGVATYFAAHHRRNPTLSGLDVFDVSINAILVATFMLSIATYLTIIRVFERLLKPYAGDGFEPWLMRLGEFERSYGQKHEYWKPQIMAEMEKRKNSGT